MVFIYRCFIAGLCDFTITFYLYIFLSMDFLSEINYMYVCMYVYCGNMSCRRNRSLGHLFNRLWTVVKVVDMSQLQCGHFLLQETFLIQ